MDAKELRGKSIDELNEELIALRREQFNLRMQRATGELAQNHGHRRVRKDIARVKTVLNERALAAGVSKGVKKKTRHNGRSLVVSLATRWTRPYRLPSSA